MSKCPKCGSDNVHLAATVPHALCVCFDCRHQWKNKYKPRKKTVFQKITASPEVLAHYLVRLTCFHHLDGSADLLFASSIVEGRWEDRAEALAATVAKLKEAIK